MTDPKIAYEVFSDGHERNEQRLVERHKRIIDSNIDAFKDRVVVDLAANNGRWSYAAAAAGAKQVYSIEARQDRADDARRFFAELGVENKIQADVGDMYGFLRDFDNGPVDTVLCLGIYYHIMDHYMLLRHIADLSPSVIIIDSGFVRSFRNSVHIQTEDPSKHRNALAAFPGQKAEVVGFVSLGLMIQMAWNCGYNCYPVAWDPKDLAARDVVQDYLMGRRFTLRLDKTDKFSDEDWRSAWRGPLELLNSRFVHMLDPETHDAHVDDRVRRPLESMAFSIM